MTKHMKENDRWRLSTEVLEGKSFSQVAKMYDISKPGAAKIFKKMKFRIFPLLTERENLGLDMNDINSLRDGWAKISMI